MNQVGARLIYANGKKVMRDADINVQSAKLTQSFLRLEQNIVVGKTQYVFPLLVNQGNPFNTEQRLNMQDAFLLSTMAVYTAVPSGATDASFRLLTYPSTQVYTTAGAAAALGTLYNGFLQIAVNNTIFNPAWDLAKHLIYPFTQQTAAVNSPVDQADYGNDGFYPVEGNIAFRGDKNNAISITLPGAGIGTIQANSRIVIFLRGLLAQNVTKVS